MNRNEKQLAALVLSANLLLGLALIRRANLGQLFTSEESPDASTVIENGPTPAVALGDPNTTDPDAFEGVLDPYFATGPNVPQPKD